MKKYAGVPGARIKGEWQTIGEHIESLREQHDGKAGVDIVLADAIDDESPLHVEFEWDDAIAGPKWREQQARYLLRSVTVIFDDMPDMTPVRAFVHIEDFYTSSEVAMSDEDMRAYVLRQIKAELQQVKAKLVGFEEFARIVAEIEEVLVA